MRSSWPKSTISSTVMLPVALSRAEMMVIFSYFSHLESWKSLGSAWSSSGRETKSVKYSSFPATHNHHPEQHFLKGTSEVGPKAPLLLALKHQLGLGIHSHSKSLNHQ